jgi:integrase
MSAMRKLKGHVGIYQRELRDGSIVYYVRARKTWHACGRELGAALAYWANERTVAPAIASAPKRKAPRERRARILSNEELAYVLAHASPDHRDAILLAVDSGLRLNELFTLRPEHVDFVHGLILLDGANTKSRRPRDIPMSGRVREILRRRFAQYGGRLFRESSSQRLSYLFHRERRRMVDIDRFRFHDMRHGFCSRLAEKGVDVATIAELAGHADVRTTTRYLHSSTDRKVAAIHLLENSASIGGI